MSLNLNPIDKILDLGTRGETVTLVMKSIPFNIDTGKGIMPNPLDYNVIAGVVEAQHDNFIRMSNERVEDDKVIKTTFYIRWDDVIMVIFDEAL